MSLILLTIVGALILLDKYAIGEFGISQPIISGTIIGAIFGDIKTGIFLGSCFQLIFLTCLPIGRDIPPEAQGAGVAGCGSYFLLLKSNNPDSALILSLIIGIFAGFFGSTIDIAVRYYNEKFYRLFLRDERNLSLYHFLGIGTAFLRGIIHLLPLFIIATVIHLPAQQFTMRKAFLIPMVGGIGMANGLYLFLKKRNLFYFILGVLCSSVLVAF